MTNEITMPDFEQRAYNLLVETLGYSIGPRGIRYIAGDLELIFEQGRALGRREALEKQESQLPYWLVDNNPRKQ